MAVTMTSSSRKPSLLGPFLYDTHVEIFMAVRDLEQRYGLQSRNSGAKISPDCFQLTMIGYSKPPGALQWVEQCVTETIYKEKNPRFAMKMNIDCDAEDTAGVELKFELFDGSYFGPQKSMYLRSLGMVQTSLSRLLSVGSVGFLVPLEFQDDVEPGFRQRHKVTSAQCFLRAEVLRPVEDAVILRFGLAQKDAPTFFTRKFPAYYMELLKINEGVNFEINQPYTLIHRSDPITMDPPTMSYRWSHIIIPIVKVCNADLNRVLKIVIYDSNQTFMPDGERTKIGFVLTTLRKLLDHMNQNPNKKLAITKCKDGKEFQKISLEVNQCSIIALAPLETFLQNGLVIRRIYAVDYSKSNWNHQLHKSNLYEVEPETPGRVDGGSSSAPYEQALELVAKIIDPITSGQAVFYSFGNASMKQFVETMEEKHQLRQLFHYYGEALSEAKLYIDEYGGPLSEDVTSGQCFQKLTLNNSTKPSTLLAPLLNDLLALLSLRVGATKLEYFVAFIFTDGEFNDLEESMKLIIELAKHPISIVFIAIGLGSLEFPLILQQISPTTNEFPKRNIITVIHFRSLQNWYSAIKYGSSFKKDPMMLLQKEIYTAIDKQAVKFMRLVGP